MLRYRLNVFPLLLLTLLLIACGGATTAETLPSASQNIISAQVVTTAPTETPAPTAVPSPTPLPQPEALGSPAFHQMGTSVTDDLSQDGHSWSQASPLLVDRYGSLIIPFQKYNEVNKQNIFVYSNDGGANWIDNAASEPDALIERGTVAYDAEHDVLHVLWLAQSGNEGVFYRRYTIERNAEHQITGIVRTADISPVLDKADPGPMQYQHPLLLFVDDPVYGDYGAVLAIWSARNRGETQGNEIRSSLCVMGADPLACGDPARWAAPVQADSSTIANPPQVAYSILAANQTADIPYASAWRKQAGTNAGDVYLFYYDGEGMSKGLWAMRRLRWNVETQNWSTGLSDPQTLAPQTRAGTDSGYELKQQLGSRVVEDTAHDQLYFAFANWKDDTAGDTWSFVSIDGAHGDAISAPVDVYSADGRHSYAPTGDIVFDEASNQLLVAYITTGDQHVFLQRYRDGVAQGEPLAAFQEAPVDIPLLAQEARYGESARLLMFFRDTINTPQPPYHAWFGSLNWE